MLASVHALSREMQGARDGALEAKAMVLAMEEEEEGKGAGGEKGRKRTRRTAEDMLEALEEGLRKVEEEGGKAEAMVKALEGVKEDVRAHKQPRGGTWAKQYKADAAKTATTKTDKKSKRAAVVDDDDDDDVVVEDKNNTTSGIPNAKCPISAKALDEIADPVEDQHGYVYSKAAILEYIKAAGSKKCPCPGTSHMVSKSDLRPCVAVLVLQRRRVLSQTQPGSVAADPKGKGKAAVSLV